MEDYTGGRSKAKLEDILVKFFAPINEAFNKFDTDLSQMEQVLTTALKQVRNLMSSYREEDKIDQRFVL